jgi:hypothetical protein
MMPIKATGPVVKDYELVRSDQEFGNDGIPTSVAIRQATALDIERRAELTARVRATHGPDGTYATERDWNYPRIQRLEVYLTLADSNIEDEDGKPLFKFKKGKTGIPELAMSEAEFNDAWKKLPWIVCEEMHECAIRTNPQWGYVVDEEGE